MIKVVIAEEREIVSQGLVNIISTIDNVEVSAIKTNSADLLEYAKNYPVDIVVLDYDRKKKSRASYCTTRCGI